MAILSSVETCPHCYGTGKSLYPDAEMHPRCPVCEGSGKTSKEILEKAQKTWARLQANGGFINAPSLIGKSYEEFKTNDPIGASEFEDSL